jgi:hypothetical protein
MPVVEFLLESWEAKLKDIEYYDVHDALEAGIASLKKTYTLMDHTDVHVLTLGEFPR